MTYNIKTKLTLNSLGIYALGIILPLLSVPAWFLFDGGLLPVIILIAGSYCSYVIFRAIFRIRKSRIITYDEGMTVYTQSGEKFSFEWNEITHAGCVIKNGEIKTYFAYAEKKDKFVQTPPSYFDFDDFVSELKEKTPFKEYTLSENETLRDALRKELGIACEESNESSCSDNSDDSDNSNKHDEA